MRCGGGDDGLDAQGKMTVVETTAMVSLGRGQQCGHDKVVEV